jgi:hypothetical protein
MPRRRSGPTISRGKKGWRCAVRWRVPRRFVEGIFAYLSIPEKEFPVASRCFKQPITDRRYFMHLADRFCSPDLWKFEDGEWRLRRTIWQHTPVGGDYVR